MTVNREHTPRKLATLEVAPRLDLGSFPAEVQRETLELAAAFWRGKILNPERREENDRPESE